MNVKISSQRPFKLFGVTDRVRARICECQQNCVITRTCGEKAGVKFVKIEGPEGFREDLRSDQEESGPIVLLEEER